MKRGRPPKFTKEIQDAITEKLAGGIRITLILSMLNITRTTYSRWRKVPSFCDAVKKAIAQSEASLIEGLRLAQLDPKNWTAIAWELERRWPDRWGKRERRFEISSTEKEDPPCLKTVLTGGRVLTVAPGDDPIEKFHELVHGEKPKEPK